MRVTHLVLGLGLSLLTVVGLVGQGANTQVVILDAKLVGDQLTVTGTNFGAATPWVFLGGEAVLTVESHTDTSVVVALAPVPEPGTYVLSIMRPGTAGKAKKKGGRSRRSLGTLDVTFGAAGPSGADGASGATGATGPTGPPGANGAEGAPGADGAPGELGLADQTCPAGHAVTGFDSQGRLQCAVFEGTGSDLRYIDNGDGTVKDTLTGLYRLLQANCLGSATFDDARDVVAPGLAAPACGLTDGSVAGDWRLPTRNEWEATIAAAVALGCTNFGASDPPSLTNDAGTACLNVGPSSFTGVRTHSYWSSNVYEPHPPDARYASLQFGATGNADMVNTLRVWPVRLGP